LTEILVLNLIIQIWMELTIFKWQWGQISTVLDTLSKALVKFLKFDMIQAQIHQLQKTYPLA
jgi:hypothetical protein